MRDKRAVERRAAARADRRPPRAEQLVVETIAAHADALLRTARRHSLCADDAHDAYQRGLEIFLRHAARLDPERASRWLHTVIRHEALALARAHARTRAWSPNELNHHEDGGTPVAEQVCERLDLRERARRDLPRLKPHERRALALKAAGHSYQEISQITGWTYTKVNRCLTEGRGALERLHAEATSQPVAA